MPAGDAGGAVVRRLVGGQGGDGPWARPDLTGRGTYAILSARSQISRAECGESCTPRSGEPNLGANRPNGP